MSHYHVQRSIVIDVPLLTLRDSLKNFKDWPFWSPWLVMEPDATLTYTTNLGEVGSGYAWSGTLVGAGSVELLEVKEDALKMHISFVQPMKSSAEITFNLEEEAEGTRVTWMMDGHLPFFMFWMTGKMQSFIGMDYERGLLMLKEYMETGAVASYVHIEGVLPMKVQNYIGIPNHSSIDKVGEVMKKDFEKLYDFMKTHNLSLDRIPFTIYNTFNIFQGETEYVACIPVNEEIQIDESWVRGSLDIGEALKTMHKGRHLHLGNGWMTAMSFARLKNMKVLKSPVGYEFYPNNPYQTPEEELVTEIFIPLK